MAYSPHIAVTQRQKGFMSTIRQGGFFLLECAHATPEIFPMIANLGSGLVLQEIRCSRILPKPLCFLKFHAMFFSILFTIIGICAHLIDLWFRKNEFEPPIARISQMKRGRLSHCAASCDDE